MQSAPPPAWQSFVEPAPPPPPPPVAADELPPVRRKRVPVDLRAVVPLALVAIALGVLLGARASAEDGRSAAAAALADGNPARAVSLDESVASRGGILTVLDPGAASAAEHDAEVARLAWARQLAAAGNIDSALAELGLVGEPSLQPLAARTRAQLLVGAAAAVMKDGHASLALHLLDEAAVGPPPSSLVATIASMKAADEVQAAAELVAAGRAPDAVALLDDASAHGAASAAAAYPSTLLAAARSEIAALDDQEAAATLQRLTAGFPSTAQAAVARALLRTPELVSGTLVDAAGHPASGRVRLSTHFSQLFGGYTTTGPFYYGTADANGDFTITGVPVGGPYVLEYFRGGSWMTLIDPRTDQPANPVSVAALQPEDLTFIVLP